MYDELYAADTSTKISDLDHDFLHLALALVVKGEDQVKPTR
jgi:hypothetical protein